MFIFLVEEVPECTFSISCNLRLCPRENSRNFIVDDGSSIDWSDDLFFDDDPETELSRDFECMTQIIMIADIGDDMATTTSETRLHDDRLLYPIKYFSSFFICPSIASIRYRETVFETCFFKNSFIIHGCKRGLIYIFWTRKSREKDDFFLVRSWNLFSHDVSVDTSIKYPHFSHFEASFFCFFPEDFCTRER
jgi:hypothetical protein